jgi:hypothetical protein
MHLVILPPFSGGNTGLSMPTELSLSSQHAEP